MKRRAHRHRGESPVQVAQWMPAVGAMTMGGPASCSAPGDEEGWKSVSAGPAKARIGEFSIQGRSAGRPVDNSE
jgi:hypothetical protein